MATQQEYLAAIQRERDANARAQAEGYESAAHKESHANVGAQAAGFSDAAAYERDADIRAQAAGFDSAVAQEIDANKRSQAAGFTSAVDQEINANRRAREAGYLNAADYESGLRTRSDAPFLDPRLQPAPVIPDKFALGKANLLKYNPDQPSHPDYDPNWRDDYPGGFDIHGNPITSGGLLDGPPNPTVPSFGYQDWSRFMPTNFGLAEGGGMHYQPWAQGGGPYTIYSSCFVDGVQVELVDGSEKNVSEISVGDEVKTDKGDGVVTKIYPSKAGGQKLYGFNDKEPFVTEVHPFMTQDGWKKISEVTEGDTLYRNGKGIVTVESITSTEIPEDTPVYNFHVDGHETYFADGYLVHNKTYAPGYEPGGPNFVPGTGPGVINPNIWGNPNTNTTTTTNGVIPGSDKAKDLANGRTHHPDMYDSNDMWVGAEGGGGAEAQNQVDFGVNPASGLGRSFMNALANNPITRLTNTLNSQLQQDEARNYGWSGADTDADISDSEVDIAQGVL
jgi:hypothetical protein